MTDAKNGNPLWNMLDATPAKSESMIIKPHARATAKVSIL
jgi:hypothetical protein